MAIQNKWFEGDVDGVRGVHARLCCGSVISENHSCAGVLLSVRTILVLGFCYQWEPFLCWGSVISENHSCAGVLVSVRTVLVLGFCYQWEPFLCWCSVISENRSCAGVLLSMRTVLLLGFCDQWEPILTQYLSWTCWWFVLIIHMTDARYIIKIILLAITQ